MRRISTELNMVNFGKDREIICMGINARNVLMNTSQPRKSGFIGQTRYTTENTIIPRLNINLLTQKCV